MFSQMKTNRIDPSAVALSLAILTVGVLVSGAPAEALETEVCRIEILVDGKPLTELAARGTTTSRPCVAESTPCG